MTSHVTQVKKAYRKLALKYHPDKCIQSGMDADEASTKMRELNVRYVCVYAGVRVRSRTCVLRLANFSS